jgi:hypothetical protein
MKVLIFVSMFFPFVCNAGDVDYLMIVARKLSSVAFRRMRTTDPFQPFSHLENIVEKLFINGVIVRIVIN